LQKEGVFRFVLLCFFPTFLFLFLVVILHACILLGANGNRKGGRGGGRGRSHVGNAVEFFHLKAELAPQVGIALVVGVLHLQQAGRGAKRDGKGVRGRTRGRREMKGRSEEKGANERGRTYHHAALQAELEHARAVDSHLEGGLAL